MIGNMGIWGTLFRHLNWTDDFQDPDYDYDENEGKPVPPEAIFNGPEILHSTFTCQNSTVGLVVLDRINYTNFCLFSSYTTHTHKHTLYILL